MRFSVRCFVPCVQGYAHVPSALSRVAHRDEKQTWARIGTRFGSVEGAWAEILQK